jgi:hypothetical protein
MSAEIAWRQYIDSDWGIRLTSEAPEWREYRIENPSGSLVCRSMLMRYELAILYAIAKHNYRGIGAIVDAGPLTGVTTNSLAKGILSNPDLSGGRQRIFAFDLFDYIPRQETLANVPNVNGSIMNTFLAVNRDYLDLISISPGDLLLHPWNSGKIEILMIDLAKSWALNGFVLDHWFPQLGVGSYLIQQDYCSWQTYWLPITMMALKDHFELVDYAMGGSTVFRCTKLIPAGMGAAIRGMPFEKHERLLDEAIATAPVPMAPVLMASKALFYTVHALRDRAFDILNHISVERQTEDWAHDFSGVALGSRDIVKFLTQVPTEQLSNYWVEKP